MCEYLSILNFLTTKISLYCLYSSNRWLKNSFMLTHIDTWYPDNREGGLNTPFAVFVINEEEAGMRILFVTPYVPSRIRVRPYQLIKALSTSHEVSLVALLCDEYEGELTQELS